MKNFSILLLVWFVFACSSETTKEETSQEEPVTKEEQLAWFQDKLNESDLTYGELFTKTTLNLYTNSLTSLPDGIFADLSRLGVLGLYTNSLTSLPNGIFDDLSSLEDLDLNDNSLTTLPSGIFDDLSRLGVLGLYTNGRNCQIVGKLPVTCKVTCLCSKEYL